MLSAPAFYFASIRKYIIIMATLFDNVNVPRYKSDGVTLDELVKVPVLVGPRDKTLARLFADPNITRMQAFTMPRISFELTNMRYAPERKQTTIETFTVQDPNNVNNYFRQYIPAPYDLHFSAYVYTKTAEDGAKIIEQIIPFFQPEYFVRAELVTDTDVEQNIAINLDNVSGPQDNYATSDAIDRRAVIWTLDFTLKGFFYGPIHDVGLIKFITVRLLAPSGDETGAVVNGEWTSLAGANSINSGFFDQFSLQPGLLANGSPTTNAALSIPYTQIHLGDDWGYAFITHGDVPPGANQFA